MIGLGRRNFLTRLMALPLPFAAAGLAGKTARADRVPADRERTYTETLPFPSDLERLSLTTTMDLEQVFGGDPAGSVSPEVRHELALLFRTPDGRRVRFSGRIVDAKWEEEGSGSKGTTGDADRSRPRRPPPSEAETTSS